MSYRKDKTEYINFCINSLVHIATMKVSFKLLIGGDAVRAKQGIENVIPYNKGTQTLTIRLTYFIRRTGSILSFVKYI